MRLFACLGSVRSRNQLGRIVKSMRQRSEQKRYLSSFDSALRHACSSVSSQPHGSHAACGFARLHLRLALVDQIVVPRRPQAMLAWRGAVLVHAARTPR